MSTAYTTCDNNRRATTAKETCATATATATAAAAPGQRPCLIPDTRRQPSGTCVTGRSTWPFPWHPQACAERPPPGAAADTAYLTNHLVITARSQPVSQPSLLPSFSSSPASSPFKLFHRPRPVAALLLTSSSNRPPLRPSKQAPSQLPSLLPTPPSTQQSLALARSYLHYSHTHTHPLLALPPRLSI
ncbi:uncharacterized protein SETTUDRAFT_30154 [Exserohilum turcica Et28A]|uniref:Uncharacterized protein n=1 Tax=Exserohilum turcicum (strain 28A) TaxID=671987 RepID=R0KFP6_EXST2|nr:uncharacterized protein SETTUDRAFT_30154 [Exserohilum turcica Et28A]EOA91628.1 hypothetical protein SETTUDRAFT_30154 [Exserohilum turcica Et28A]